LEVGQLVGFCRSHWTDFAVLAGCALATVALGAGAVRFSKKERAGAPTARLDENGGLSEELVLVFPFFLFFLAMTIQMILLLNARLVVNYAAFVAGRSASVWIAARTDYEPANLIQIVATSANETQQDPNQSGDLSGLTDSPAGSPTEKFDRIHGAAALACAPISPNYFSFLADLYPFTAGICSSAARLATNILNGVHGMPLNIIRLGPRWIYANKHTLVYFQDEPNAEVFSPAPFDNIKVTVEHRFHLSVPWVGGPLALGGMAASYYTHWESWLSLGFLNWKVYYVPIRESYVFRNEGESIAPGC
jgi:hypothetical protein